MVISITEKFSTLSSMSTYNTYINTPVQKPQTSVVQVDVQTDKKLEEQKNKNKLLMPLSLVAGGGILLYFGLKHPSYEKMYNKFVNGKIFDMDKRMHLFTARVVNRLNDVTSEATKFIQEFKAKRYINPADNLGPLRTLKDPRQLIHAQDIAFETITTAGNSYFKPGATDFGDFGSTMRSLICSARHDMAREQNITKLDLNDFIKIPIARNEKHAGLIEAAENKLISSVNFMSMQTGKIIDEQTLSTIKRLYVQMANAVLESKRRIRQSKMNVIDETYVRMSKVLGLKDFKPSYHSIPVASGFDELTAQQLKPTKLPSKLRKAAPNNSYLNALQTKDFSNLTDKDLYEIFYSANYENSLQDLGFLIDRLRLRQAVDKAKAPERASSYDVIIPKLEYLSKRLHEFGKRELFGVLDKDFDNMRVENKQASVYYILRVAKRLGYQSLQEMDQAMMKENAAYPNLSIRKYIQIFIDNPDLYFS